MSTPDPHSALVVGAGIVGVSVALALQQRSWRVQLIDRETPGTQTSYGNAGVLTRSSLLPFNHPGLWAGLPTLLQNRSTSFRYRPAYLARNAGWALGFLASARPGVFEQTLQALDGLIGLSMAEHERLLAEAGALHRLRRNGWLMLYRSAPAWAAGALARATCQRFGVQTEVLDAAALQALEPALAPIFSRALWVQDAWSVDSPGAVVQAYAALFAARGGQILRSDVAALARQGECWCAADRQGRRFTARHAVLALGPWSKTFLQHLGLSVPLGFERGYHMHYGPAPGAPSGPVLQRPIVDTGGGYVLSPMAQGLRLSTGVELADLDAPPDLSQLNLAEQAARQALSLGPRLDQQPWLGRRPTLPDSRPAIGPAPGRPGLWLAFGHQHIGLNTGPGSAQLLAAMMTGEPPPLPAAPFDPARFVR